ncbi:hypothetical protein NE236_26330 [Actinoallomurus purpureus]|uniref:hypothetical protein n=1 Tax=Actinoallomurus purpureus TaxID=478114 RepID=UPI002092A0ED|nr:hypothetical protein [Actinoallomurus purpureus]MCO6008499.1 hypothetical protein [Actinoallomurus purpureus]
MTLKFQSEAEYLASLLMRGAGGNYVYEASVQLLVRHGYWLSNRDLLKFVVTYEDPPAAAGIEWGAAVAALDSGDLEADQEQAVILRIAASISGACKIALFDVVQGIDRQNIKYIAEALMYADGFLGSIADPIP